MHKSVPMTIAAVLAVVLSAGLATAATSHGKTVKACVSKKGFLGAASAKGKCGNGFKKTAIAKAGPRGATGLRGLPGAPGTPGSPGAPGTDNITPVRYLQVTESSAAGMWADVASVGGITLQAECYQAGVSIEADMRIKSTIDTGGTATTDEFNASDMATPTGVSVVSSASTPSAVFGAAESAFSTTEMSNTVLSLQLGSAGPQLTGIISTQAVPSAVAPAPECIFDGNLTLGPTAN